MPLQLETIDWSTLSPGQRRQVLRRPVFDQPGLADSVAAILSRVREGGDEALLELTRQFDSVSPTALEVARSEWQEASGRVDPKVIAAIRDAGGRIEAFHRADLPRDNRLETAPGLECEVRYQALSPVGLYIPGGSAPLVSTVLMLALPAALAGCEEIVMCSPPGKDGRIADEVLTAAWLCGVTRVFCAGGAQAIAAMAYGTASVPRCAKIFGPGNAWVTEAKQQVSQDPDGAAIDLPAGPSEVLVIADADANAEHIAWDLLSQAEHGPDSQVILLTICPDLAARVIGELEKLAPQSPRVAILEQSLAASRIIRVADLDSAMSLSNEYAPEHLILNIRDAAARAGQVRNWARSHGALGVGDFMRRMTLQQASRDALAQVGPTAEALAAVEGLDAHRMAVRSRLTAQAGAEEEPA